MCAMENNQRLPNDTRERNPCQECTEKQYPVCYDVCPRRAAWLAERERVNGNRREHYRKNGIREYPKLKVGKRHGK